MGKILGMIRYEMLMAWRRGSTRLILFVMLALPIATFIYTSDLWIEGIECMCGPDGEPFPADLATLSQTYAVLGSAMFIVPILMLIVPVMISDTVPLDRHYGINQILNSLPITPATYLLGKVGGAVVSVIIATGIGALLWGAVVLIRQYTPEPSPILIFWIGSLVLGIISTVLGVIIPAVSPNRRKAVAWGFAASFLAVIFSTMLPMYEVAQKSMERIGEMGYPASKPLADLVKQYPNPFGTGFLINYTIMLIILIVITGIVLWRMHKSDLAI